MGLFVLGVFDEQLGGLASEALLLELQLFLRQLHGIICQALDGMQPVAAIEPALVASPAGAPLEKIFLADGLFAKVVI